MGHKVTHAVKCIWTNGNQHEKGNRREFGTDTSCRFKKTKELGAGGKGMHSKMFQPWFDMVLPKESAKFTEKEILHRVLFGFDCKGSKDGCRLQLRRLRITMVKVWKSSLAIVRIFRYFHCRQHFWENNYD
jgi:hypothetical protein